MELLGDSCERRAEVVGAVEHEVAATSVGRQLMKIGIGNRRPTAGPCGRVDRRWQGAAAWRQTDATGNRRHPRRTTDPDSAPTDPASAAAALEEHRVGW